MGSSSLLQSSRVVSQVARPQHLRLCLSAAALVIGSLSVYESRRCLLVPLLGKPPKSPSFEIIDGPTSELHLAVLRNLFDPKEVEALREVAQDDDTWRHDDRDENLGYAHEVWRFEEVLQQRRKDLFDRLISTAWALDKSLWQNILDFTFPEIEYIEYDVKKLGRPGFIGYHRDNFSLVTVIVLLSDPSEFQGGVNCFEGVSRSQHREVALKIGDAVAFYGHRCHHWITPVTSGRRVILQMELRTYHEDSPEVIFRRQERK
eukprot:TRINITY_DN80508_c0_g1_i1.p1 TRINITY_DN80508_c0_g1~~TRINITY_DN80508_c0_g1_i1.p1  ORF type:complete len:261 (+),score=31.19 TRINITY_DN80508_c0_g1_i1:78-860(+)